MNIKNINIINSDVKITNGVLFIDNKAQSNVTETTQIIINGNVNTLKADNGVFNINGNVLNNVNMQNGVFTADTVNGNVSMQNGIMNVKTVKSQTINF